MIQHLVFSCDSGSVHVPIIITELLIVIVQIILRFPLCFGGWRNPLTIFLAGVSCGLEHALKFCIPRLQVKLLQV